MSDDGNKRVDSTPQGNGRPEAPQWLFDNISEASKNARKMYFVLLGFITYCSLAVLNTSDRELVLNDAVMLPLVSIELPLTAFLIAAPLLSLSVFLFFQLYLARLRGMIDTLRNDHAPVPKRRLYPWILNSAEDPEEGLTGWLQKLVVSVSLWWLLPSVLGLFALLSVKTHQQALSYLLAFCTVGGALLVVFFWRRFESRNHLVGPLLLLTVAILFGALQTFYVIPNAHSGIPWPDPIAKRIGENEGTLHKFLRRLVSVDISYNVLVEEPKFGKDRVPWVNLKQARLEGANMTATVLQRADLREARLDGAYMERSNLAGALLEGANLDGAILYNADLTRADLRGASLRDAKLREADLRGANLAGADLTGAELRYATLIGANFDHADLTDADLLYADASGATFRETLLCNADLRYVNLADATLIYSNLYDAKLQGANFRDMTMRKVYMVGANGVSAIDLLQAKSLYSLIADPGIIEALQVERPELLDQDLELLWHYKLQGVLRDEGLYYGPIDGRFGPVTREGLTRLQQRHKLDVTGRLDSSTRAKIELMAAQRNIQYLPSLGTEFQHGLDTVDMRFAELQETLQQHGFLGNVRLENLETAVQNAEFLEAVARFQAAMGLIPDGTLGPQSAKKLLAVHSGTAKPIMSVEDAQTLLRNHGAYQGEVTSSYNVDFEQALIQFQGEHCLVPDGRIRAETATILSVTP